MGLKHIVAAILAGALLSGCNSPVATALVSAAQGRNTDAAPKRLKIDRSAFEKAGVAALAVYSESTGIEAATVAVQKRDDAVVYLSATNRSVIMRGGLVQTTRGFGTNLQFVSTDGDDPVVRQKKPGSWGAHTTRVYEFARRGAAFERVTARCRIENFGAKAVDVVGVTRRGIVMVEKCRTDTGVAFSNQYLVDQSNGIIWSSVQWTGPVQGMMQINVIEPFDP